MSSGWMSRLMISVVLCFVSASVGVGVVQGAGDVISTSAAGTSPPGSVQTIDEYAKGVLETLARVEPRVERDKSAVVIFFDFFCPHCAEHVPMLLHWADTVPKDKVHVRFAPVIAGDAKRIWLAYGFFVGTKVLGYRGSVALAQELFDLVRSPQGFALETVNEILAKHCGRERILGFYALDDVKEDIKAVDVDLTAYRVQAVPSVGIAGRYVITPDDLPPGSGREAFVALLNGFVSRMVAADL